MTHVVTSLVRQNFLWIKTSCLPRGLPLPKVQSRMWLELGQWRHILVISANHLTTRSSSRTRIHLITFVEKNHQGATHEARLGGVYWWWVFNIYIQQQESKSTSQKLLYVISIIRFINRLNKTHYVQTFHISLCWRKTQLYAL